MNQGLEGSEESWDLFLKDCICGALWLAALLSLCLLDSCFF